MGRRDAKADGVRVSDGALGLGYGGCLWPVKGAPAQEVLVHRRPERRTKMVEVRYETLLNRRLSPTEQLAVVSHGLGHLYCGHVGTHEPTWWRARTTLSSAIEQLRREAAGQLGHARAQPHPGVCATGHEVVLLERRDNPVGDGAVDLEVLGDLRHGDARGGVIDEFRALRRAQISTSSGIDLPGFKSRLGGPTRAHCESALSVGQ